jgi:hypothetical protein
MVVARSTPDGPRADDCQGRAIAADDTSESELLVLLASWRRHLATQTDPAAARRFPRAVVADDD